MRHQLLIGAVKAAELAEVIRHAMLAGEQRRKARQAGVDRIAPGMDDARVGQKMDEAEQGNSTASCR